jgi:hypothetical protein
MLSSSDSASGAEPPGDPPVGKNWAKFAAYNVTKHVT